LKNVVKLRNSYETFDDRVSIITNIEKCISNKSSNATNTTNTTNAANITNSSLSNSSSEECGTDE
jgi:hypothetical protein